MNIKKCKYDKREMYSEKDWYDEMLNDENSEEEEEEEEITINEDDETMYDRIWVNNFQGSGKRELVMRYQEHSMSLTARRPCVNAITGNTYVDENGHKIYHGSKESKRLYGVNDITAKRERYDTVRLYYDSPEQYESHLGVKVPQELKKRWHDSHRLA